MARSLWSRPAERGPHELFRYAFSHAHKKFERRRLSRVTKLFWAWMTADADDREFVAGKEMAVALCIQIYMPLQVRRIHADCCMLLYAFPLCEVALRKVNAGTCFQVMTG